MEHTGGGQYIGSYPEYVGGVLSTLKGYYDAMWALILSTLGAV